MSGCWTAWIRREIESEFSTLTLVLRTVNNWFLHGMFCAPMSGAFSSEYYMKLSVLQEGCQHSCLRGGGQTIADSSVIFIQRPDLEKLELRMLFVR